VKFCERNVVAVLNGW